MAFWKVLGLVGGACLAPFTGGTSLVASIALCGGIGLVAGHFLDENEDKKKKENAKLALAGKAGEAITGQVNNLQNQRNQVVQEAEDLVKELQRHKAKLNDPNATPEEKDMAKKMIPIIESQLDDKNKKISDFDKKINDLLKSIPDGSGGNKGLINLEMDYQTKLIAGAIIFLVIYFTLIKEDREK